MILLAGSFTFKYLGHTYFSQGILDVKSPGFWLMLANIIFITSILLLNKQAAGWTWKELGLAKPAAWWQPVIVAAGVFAAVLLLLQYVRPFFLALGTPPDISHLFVLKQNLPLLIFAIIAVWITAAFLEELIFRAFFINSFDLLLGRNSWSPWAAVLISSVIFGMLHSWQGLSGMLVTACIGFIFGVAYLFNGRRILALVLVHGIVDTITLLQIYNM